MTVVYGIRHPESARNLEAHLVGGRSNEALVTPRGYEQMHRLGKVFLHHYQRPVAVFSSPATRTRVLAEHLAKTLSIPDGVIVHDNLQEMSQGFAEGQPRREVYTQDVLAQIALQQKAFALPGGESVNQVTDRILATLHEINDTYPDQPVAIAGHGQALRCALGEILGWSHTDITRPTDPRYMTDNVSITEFRIVNHNITASLPRSIITPVPRREDP